MKLKKKSDLIKNVAENWKRQYWYPRKGWSDGFVNNLSKEEIYHRLSDLPKQATEDDVIAIIGNGSWTRNRCDECDEDVDVTVHLGDEPDYDAAYVFVCMNCLKKAIELIGEEDETGQGFDTDMCCCGHHLRTHLDLGRSWQEVDVRPLGSCSFPSCRCEGFETAGKEIKDGTGQET